MPSMWDWRRDTPNYLPLPQGVELQPSEDDVASTASSPASMNSSAVRPGVNGRHHVGDGTLSPRKLSKKDGRMQTAISTSLSVFMVIFVCSLSLGLGGYSVFIFKPAPVIDKSVDAFSIPNHNASKGYHALQQAKSRRIFGRRSGKVKRDTAKTHGAQHRNSFVDEDFAGNIQDRLDLGAVLPREEMFRDVFTMAKEPHRVVRRGAERLQQSRHPRTYYSVRQGRVQWRLEVIFKAVDEKGESANIFTKERLETVHSIEQQIINHPNYTKFCWVDIDSQSSKNKAYNGCTPLNSLMTYFYPSVLPNGQLLYDGRGSNMADINSSLGLAMSHKQFYYFVDENVNSQNPKSRLLRTEVLFGAPLEGFASALTDKKQQADLYEKFVVTYIDMLSSASTSKVQVMYGGNEIFDYEVDAAFWRDLWLARFALLFIGLFVLVLTSFSVWLSFWGLVAIGLSFPLALFLYRFVFSIQALGILNGVAAFVVIGIGVDDVFVFVNTFRQAEHMDKIKGRLLYTVKTAGTATFFTSFTTAAAFAANIASTIPALHEFGLFMALIVVCCWVSVVLLMPPVLYLWYLVFAYIEGSLFKAAKRLFYRIVLRQDINTLQVYYRSGIDQIVTDASVSPQADDDVPMLTLENEETVESDDDEPLLVPYLGESQAPFQSPSSKQTKGRQLLDLGHFLQLALCRYITQPVIKYRWVVAVVYVVILATSIGLVTQIKLSSKPPQLFRDSSNLQRMLDLKANLSIDKFFCPRCSGAYSDTAASLPNNPEIPQIPSHIPAKWENMTYPPEGFPKPTLPWKLTKSPPTKKPNPKRHKSTMRPSSQSKSMSTAAPTQRPPTRSDNKSPMTTSPPAIHHKHDVTTNRKSSPTTSPHPPVVTSPVGVSSLPKGFKVCQGKDCGKAEKRPVMESHAIVYVVFGIQSLDRSNLTSNHVINNNYGTVIYDDKFAQHFRRNASHSVSPADIKELCRVCKRIAANSELVINGSAQCLPRMMEQLIGTYLQNFPECHGLPRNLRLYNQQAPGHAEARPTDDLMGIRWMAFAFESTTSKGQSYFQAYDEYLKWEKFIGTVRSEIRADSPLRSIYQASDFWTKVLMEVVCVSSAIYGVVLSIFVCIIAVAIFTGHFLLLLIVLLTIGGIISLVVAVFFLCGWEMGAVEAVSLSILVGSSVDYCVHVVEGYLLAGQSPHLNAIQSASEQRQWRVMQAVQHIGVSIVSSALTTIAAAIPLTQATIRPFSRFGDIVAMNTAFAIVYTLTACSAFLAIFAPARFKSSWRSSGIALAITLACTGVFVLVLYILSRVGVTIPSPNGDALFPN